MHCGLRLIKICDVTNGDQSRARPGVTSQPQSRGNINPGVFLQSGSGYTVTDAERCLSHAHSHNINLLIIEDTVVEEQRKDKYKKDQYRRVFTRTKKIMRIR